MCKFAQMVNLWWNNWCYSNSIGVNLLCGFTKFKFALVNRRIILTTSFARVILCIWIRSNSSLKILTWYYKFHSTILPELNIPLQMFHIISINSETKIFTINKRYIPLHVKETTTITYKLRSSISRGKHDIDERLFHVDWMQREVGCIHALVI